MKLYTFYTDSHNTLFEDFFMPSLDKVKNINVIAKKDIQKCNTGSYMDAGWLETMKFKVSLHIESSSYHNDEFYIYSDCDVIFLDKNLIEYLMIELGDNDMAFQNDVEPYGLRPTCCAGFFISRCNIDTKNLWIDVLNDLKQLPLNTKLNDQSLLNSHLDFNRYNLKYKLLSNKFFTLAQYRKEVWDKDTNCFDFDIPSDIITYHANWTHGVPNKIHLLKLVQKKKDTIL